MNEKRKNLKTSMILTIPLLVFALLLPCGCFAYAVEPDLTAASVSDIQAQSVKKTTKIQYVLHIARLRSKYANEYTKSEKKDILSLLSKAADAKKTKTARKASSKADDISKRAIKLYKAKNKAVKSTKSKYTELKGYLKSGQKKEIKSIIDRMGKTRMQSKLSKLKEKSKAIFSIGKLRKRYDAVSWSDEKLYYVSEWGPRIDSYLEGTPMADTGIMIARVAYDHGMDARLYPSIACVESGCGVAPYGSPYNVCGWVWNPPAMYSWEDACIKWHDFFQAYFGDEWYPISSMHGYGGYGPWYVNEQIAKI